MFDRSLHSDDDRDLISASVRRADTEMQEDHPQIIAMHGSHGDQASSFDQRHHRSLRNLNVNLSDDQIVVQN